MTTVSPIPTPESSDADAIAVAAFEGEELPHDSGDGALAALVDSTPGRLVHSKLTATHADGRTWLVAGLGARGQFDTERARSAAAGVCARAAESGARSLCLVPPGGLGGALLAGFAEGAALAGYRFDRYKQPPGEGEDEDGRIAHVDVVADGAGTAAVEAAAIVAQAQNDARDLQNTPANDMTPAALAARAEQLAGELDGLSAEVEGREEIVSRGMGAFACVAQGSHVEPRLITLRYEGPGASGPVLGLVGKAVTFDTGGISIKPSAKMEEMKFDMSGGAAVLEGIGAIARLGLPLRAVAVIGATENMLSGHAVKPGDIVTAMTGTTIEVNNTDAEGRLVLADCLAHAIEQGAERLVDFATLTGAIIVALGSAHAGLFANDDGWAGAVQAAAAASGERVWRLPLHPDYAEMVKGRYADLANVTDKREASSITAAEFLKRFVGDVPWAHVDIAGTAWDSGKPYASKGGSGFGVRLIVELARGLAGPTA